MKPDQARKLFIASWASFAAPWGITRTMAAIHAVLLLSPEPLTAHDIMEQLRVGRGIVSTNMAKLIDWELAERILVTVERREMYQAQKDMWHIARCVADQRRRRELKPLLHLLDKVKGVQGDKEFTKLIGDIAKFANQADALIELMQKVDSSWLFKLLK